jgi:hypothetical protein
VVQPPGSDRLIDCMTASAAGEMQPPNRGLPLGLGADQCVKQFFG